MHDQNPVLSVIVPHYDSEDMLKELLNSFPARRDIEVLVVDDHSPNPPSIKPEDYVYTLKILQNTPGQRYAGTARNLGLEWAGGDWTMFMDADDLVDPEQLSDVIDHILEEGHKDSSADVYHFYGASFREDGGKGQRHLTTNWLIYNFEKRGDEGPIFHAHPPWGKVIRTEFIRSNRLEFSSSGAANDVMFNIHLNLARPRRKVLPNVVHHIRQGAVSMTTDLRVEKIQDRIRVLREANAVLKSAGESRYQHPLWLQLHYLTKIDRGAALREIVRSLCMRQPIFCTRWTLKRKVLSTLDMRRGLFPH